MSFLSSDNNRESHAPKDAAPLGDKGLLAGILGLTALLYLPTLRFEFVYDDQGIIVDNPLIHSWRFVPQLFQGQLWQHLFPNAPSNYYRPLSALLFRVDDALFGLHPMGWHASAILLHLVATALVFLIVRSVTERSWVAAVTAVLFGVHPTRHEVVAWVSAMTESLCAVLYLAAFWAYLKSRAGRTAAWLSLSAVFYGAGILAKETAMVLPALVFAHAYLYGVREVQPEPITGLRRLFQAVARASVYAPVLILYAVLRIHVLHEFTHSHGKLALSTLLLTWPSVMFFYLRQWVLPLSLSEFYDLPMRTHWDFLHVARPLAVLLVVAALLWRFRRQMGVREVCFALAAMTMPLLPAMNLSVFSPGELVHDRYFYLPGLGAALLVGLALQRLATGRLIFRMPQRLVLVLLALLLPLSYCTANATSYWVGDDVLFEHAHAVAPENPTAQNNYAVNLANRGDQGTAITVLQDLLRKHPDSFLGNYNLGRTLFDLKLYGAAEHYLQQAGKIDSGDPDVDLQLGLLCLRTGRGAEAEAHFRRALALRSTDPKSHFALGVVLAGHGDCQSARAEFAQALSLDPKLATAQEQSDKCTGAAAAAKSTVPVTGAALPAAVGLLSTLPAVRTPLTPVKEQ